MSLHTLNEAAILRYASAETLRFGQTCYEKGAVGSAVRYGTTLLAEVSEEGSAQSVLVCCLFQADGTLDATCTCQYSWKGWCEHRVAACLLLLHQPEKVEERRAFTDMLAEYSRDELQTLIVKLAGQIPHLAAAIDQETVNRQPGTPPSASAPQTRSSTAPVHVKTLRREVHATMHSLDRMRSSQAYWHVGEVVSEIEGIARRALEILARGDGRGALVALEAITDEYVDEYESLDDSDGYAGESFRALGELWAEVLLSTDLSQEERAGWADMLTAWQREIEDYGVDEGFDIAVAAALSGWGDLEHKDASDDGQEEDLFFERDALTRIKLRILEGQERFQDYLALARAEGQTGAYVVMLVRQDHAQEAVAYGQTHLTSAHDALALARALCEHGEREESLLIAEQGLTLEGSDVALAAWLRDQAEAMGRQELALKAAEQAFRSQISLEQYRHVARLAGEQWEVRKTALLAYARTAQTYETQGKVDVFLHEGLIDDAIAMVETYASHTIVSQVVDVAVRERPAWAIETCKKQAESIMDRGKSQYYQAAADWLARAHQAYKVLDQEEQWQTYVKKLLELHRRKYTLVPLLKAIR
jgi:uncharacterized Zn finger protein